MTSIVTAAVSTVSGGCIAVFSTIAIERLGGTLGGVIATIPSTLIPFSIGLVLTRDEGDIEGIDKAMYSLPVSLIVTMLFITAWRELPKLDLIRRASSPVGQLAYLVPMTMTVWFAGAVAVTFSLSSIITANINIKLIGGLAAGLTLTVGLLLLFCRDVPDPPGTKKVTLLTYVARAFLCGLSVGCAVAVSSVDPIAAGVASSFPAITTTVMVSIWFSQGGGATPLGATAPIALGTGSGFAYTMTFAEIYGVLYLEVLQGQINQATAIVLSAIIAEITAVAFYSVPIYLLISWRKSQIHSISEVNELELDSSSTRLTKENSSQEECNRE